MLAKASNIKLTAWNLAKYANLYICFFMRVLRLRESNPSVLSFLYVMDSSVVCADCNPNCRTQFSPHGLLGSPEFCGWNAFLSRHAAPWIRSEDGKATLSYKQNTPDVSDLPTSCRRHWSKAELVEYCLHDMKLDGQLKVEGHVPGIQKDYTIFNDYRM